MNVPLTPAQVQAMLAEYSSAVKRISDLAAALPSLPDAELVPALRTVQAAAHNGTLTQRSLLAVNLVNQMAEELRSRGCLTESVSLFREAHAGFSALVGVEHPFSLQVAQQLGNVLVILGNYAEATPLLESSLAGETEFLGEEAQSMLLCLVELAKSRARVSHTHGGDLEGAETLLRQGKATLSRLAANAGLSSDAPPPGLVLAWFNVNLALGSVIWKSKQFSKAELHYREMMAFLAEVPPSERSANMETDLLSALGNALSDGGNLLGAEEIYRDLILKLQGSINLGFIARNLSVVLQQRGLLTEARKFMDLAERENSRCLGATSHESRGVA